VARESLGAVLASFQLLPIGKPGVGLDVMHLVSQAGSLPPVQAIAPATKKCRLSVQLVGARDLAGRLLLPPQNPFVEIDVGARKAARRSSTSKQPSAVNANFLEVRLCVVLCGVVRC
jgi:hypothetical protein